jgi:hypothetical protein
MPRKTEELIFEDVGFPALTYLLANCCQRVAGKGSCFPSGASKQRRVRVSGERPPGIIVDDDLFGAPMQCCGKSRIKAEAKSGAQAEGPFFQRS